MSAAAETGRTGFAGTADRSTLKLDVRETPNGLRLSLPPLRPPDGCFQQARTGADDPNLTSELKLSGLPNQACRAPQLGHAPARPVRRSQHPATPDRCRCALTGNFSSERMALGSCKRHAANVHRD